MGPAFYEFHLDAPPAGLVELFMTYFGPVVRDFESLAEEPRAEELRRKLVDLISRVSRGRNDRTDIAARHLRVTVRVPQA